MTDRLCSYKEDGVQCQNIWTSYFERPLCFWHSEMLSGRYPRGPVPRILEPANAPPIRHPRELERRPDPRRYGVQQEPAAPAESIIQDQLRDTTEHPYEAPEPPEDDLPPLSAYEDLGNR